MEDAGLFVQLMWLHRVVGGDSGALVVPFMRVGTYPTRHLAHYCYLHDLVVKTRWVYCKPPCIAAWVGLYLNCFQNNFWHKVSEDSRRRGLIFFIKKTNLH